MPLKVDVVTAERNVYSGEGVDEVIVPGAEGELAILPLHAPLLTMIKPGVMRLVKGNEEDVVALTGGFLEVRDNRVTILADAAERAEEIDVLKVEEARRAAERALQEKRSEVEIAEAAAELQRALLRLRAAERRRKRPGSRPGPPPGA
jgi:F-type H+-transporting ATPase subunit epsilon